MTKKNYTIDGEELQKRISSEIDFVKHSYCKWKNSVSEDPDFYYVMFKKHCAVLRALLLIQGNDSSEVAMIMIYTKDLAIYDTMRYKIGS